MKILRKLSAFIVVSVLLGGCATPLNLSRLQAEDRLLHVGVADNGTPYVGVDLLGEAIQHPWQTLGTVSFDTASITALIKGGQTLWEHLQSSSAPSAPPPTASIFIQGNGNTVNYGRRK